MDDHSGTPLLNWRKLVEGSSVLYGIFSVVVLLASNPISLKTHHFLITLFVTPACVLSPIGGWWAVYQCVRNERRPWKYIAVVVFIPFGFVWYYFERYSTRPDTSVTNDDSVLLKLSIQRALLGAVTDRLVSITCSLSERNIKIRAFVSGEVTQEDIEHLSFVGAEVIADFSDGYTIEESCLSIRDHDEEMLDFWAFRRTSEPRKT